MFQIKICGLTTLEDALAAVEAGADAVGLNFYPKSKRCIDLRTAQHIAQALPAGVVKVGVFVNAGVDEIRRTARETPLDVVQLHGDEPPDFPHLLPEWPVLRAFRLPAEGQASAGLEPVDQALASCRAAGRTPDLALIDAFHPQEYGGTGLRADWNSLARWKQVAGRPGLVLAGGLTAENVAQAVKQVAPSAVDVASGVEKSPGVKDHDLMRRFVAAARQAFDALHDRTLREG